MEQFVYHKKGKYRRRTVSVDIDIYKRINKQRYKEMVLNDNEISFSGMLNKILWYGLKELEKGDKNGKENENRRSVS